MHMHLQCSVKIWKISNRSLPQGSTKFNRASIFRWPREQMLYVHFYRKMVHVRVYVSRVEVFMVPKYWNSLPVSEVILIQSIQLVIKYLLLLNRFYSKLHFRIHTTYALLTIYSTFLQPAVLCLSTAKLVIVIIYEIQQYLYFVFFLELENY